MHAPIPSLAGASAPLLVLARLTLVGAAGHLALALLRRGSAAARHLAAVTTLALMIATPLASGVTPGGFSVAVPASWLGVPGAAPAPKAQAPVLATAAAPPAPSRPADITAPVTASPATGVRSGPGDGHASAAPRPGRFESPFSTASARAHRGAPFARTAASGPRGLPTRPRADAPGAALAILVAVSLALAASRIRGAIAIGRVARAAAALDEPRMRNALALARERLGVRGQVGLRASERVAVPCMCGLVHPTLLLPRAALEWSESRLALVFLHELAHVRRRDGFGLLVTRAATALFWFHPLAWTLADVARRECERACDDEVLLAGARASEYADELLAIARTAAAARPAPVMALAFARPTNLESRLRSILRPDLRRVPLSRRAVALAAGLALIVLLPLASVRVVAGPRATGTCPAGVGMDATHGRSLTGTRERSATLARTITRTATSEPGAGVPPTAAAEVAPAEATDAACAAARSAACASAAARAAAEDAADAVTASSSARTWPDLGAAESKSGSEWYSAAKGHYDARRFSSAGECYERAGRAGYRAGTAWYNAACSYALDGQRNRALGALQRALEEGFDDRGTLATDGDLNAIRTDPRFRLMVDGAASTDQAEKLGALRSTYRELESSPAASARDLRSIGISLMRAGDSDRAGAAFEREYALDSLASTIYNEACARATGRQTARALETLERAVLSGYGDAEKLESDPDLVSLHDQPQFDRLVRLADDLSLNTMKDDDPDAWRAELPRYERTTQEHPAAGRAWWNLGFAELRADRPQRSVQSFGRALALGYRVSNTLYNLACAAAQSGDADAAFDYLSRAQAAGMNVFDLAPGDRDLDPLRSDPRFRALERDWRRERATEKDRDVGRKKEKTKGRGATEG